MVISYKKMTSRLPKIGLAAFQKLLWPISHTPIEKLVTCILKNWLNAWQSKNELSKTLNIIVYETKSRAQYH
jgi:hypothetical protein